MNISDNLRSMAQWIHVSLQWTNFYTRYNFYDTFDWEYTDADLQK